MITIRRVLSDTKETSVPLVGQAAIRQFFPGCISVVYKNDIVLLVSEDIGKPISIETNDDFVELLEANQMKAGVSEVFYDTTLMRRYYQQSEKAIELGVRLRPDANIFSYYQFSVYHSMEISAKSISLRDLSHPVVNYLNVSERESDKELLTTLYLWLRYDKDAAKTSNALHIHRSTLFYRLNKIKDLIGSGLDDGELTFQLMYSFKLLEYSSGFTAGN